MKRIILSVIMTIWAIICFSQESVKPTFGVELERPVAIAMIDGKTYYDVTVLISSAEYGGDRNFWREECLIPALRGVKIIVKNTAGKKIYKKRFKKSLLYAYSDGTIQVGRGNAVMNLTLTKDPETRKWYMELREKGIY